MSSFGASKGAEERRELSKEGRQGERASYDDTLPQVGIRTSKFNFYSFIIITSIILSTIINGKYYKKISQFLQKLV